MAVYHLLDAIPPAEHAAVADFTSTYDVTSAFNAMMAISGPKRIELPFGRICIGNRINMEDNTDLVGNRTELFSLAAADGGNPTQASIWCEHKNGWRILGKIRVNGNRSNRSTTGGEAAISVTGGEEFSLQDMQVVHAVGDGLSVGGDGTAHHRRAKVGTVERCVFEACGRNGISISGAYDMNFVSNRTRGQNSNSPQTGTSLEPNNAINFNENINFFGHSSVQNANWDLAIVDGYGLNRGIRFFGGRVIKISNLTGVDAGFWGTLRS